MIRACDIVNMRYVSEDYKKTEEIKRNLKELSKTRNPMYLNLGEFDSILHWKLRGQYGRQKSIREENTEEIIKIITQAAFEIEHFDQDYEAQLKLTLLCSIKGVGLPVASAFLALYHPSKYCVIDFRGWKQVFGEDKKFFTINDYLRYLKEIQKISLELMWPVQEVDLAIWEYDRRN